MNIYLVKELFDHGSYDTYDSFVIACETEDEAKNHADNLSGMSAENCTVTLVGVAQDGIKGELLASFNAG